MKRRAIGYCRVSTSHQLDGVSMDAQRAKIQAWCELNEVELAEIYSDNGMSGCRADNRPGLQGALDAACDTGGVLVFYSLSRLARNTKEVLIISERLERAGADLVSLSENIDTSSATGKMVFRLLAVLAEFERDLVSDRTKAALAHKREQGKRIGNIPFGYELAADGETLVENERERKTLNSIRRLRDKGFSLAGVAEELNRKGIRNRRGNRWTKHHIYKLASA